MKGRLLDTQYIKTALTNCVNNNRPIPIIGLVLVHLYYRYDTSPLVPPQPEPLGVYAVLAT